MRHAALRLDGEMLSVFYTNAGDCPERIVRSTIALMPNWRAWRASEPALVLEPELPDEGADLPHLPSRRGLTPEAVCQ